MIWTRRLTQLCSIGMGIVLYAQVVHGGPADSVMAPVSELERWGALIERVGFCLVGFGILAYMMYRQSALEGITERYDETQQAHLLAFKDINAAYREMLKETKDTILLSVQVQSTLLAKVEAMERTHGK